MSADTRCVQAGIMASVAVAVEDNGLEHLVPNRRV
jgi:hypothetical protein